MSGLLGRSFLVFGMPVGSSVVSGSLVRSFVASGTLVGFFLVSDTLVGFFLVSDTLVDFSDMCYHIQWCFEMSPTAVAFGPFV